MLQPPPQPQPQRPQLIIGGENLRVRPSVRQANGERRPVLAQQIDSTGLCLALGRSKPRRPEQEREEEEEEEEEESLERR
jgi:hypothetical protein